MPSVSILQRYSEVEELDEEVELVWGLILGPGSNRRPFESAVESGDEDD